MADAPKVIINGILVNAISSGRTDVTDRVTPRTYLGDGKTASDIDPDEASAYAREMINGHPLTAGDEAPGTPEEQAAPIAFLDI
jgi:hypothetical protein